MMKNANIPLCKIVFLLAGLLLGAKSYGQADPAPPDGNALYRQSQAALEAGLTREAVEALEAAVAGESDNPYLRYKLGEAYYAAGEYSAGAELCTELVERGYDPPRVWLLMGQCSQALGMPGAALLQYGEACRQEPRNRPAALKYLNLLLNQRNADRQYADNALALCDSVLRYNPFDLDVTLARGLLCYRLQNYPEAEALFTGVLERGDSLPTAVRYGALSRVEIGHNLDAQPLLRIAYERDTTDYPILFALGRSNAEMGRRAEAERFLDKAEETLRQADRHYGIEVARGNLYLQARQWEEAIRHFYTAYSRYNDRNVSLLSSCYTASLNLERHWERSNFLLYTLLSRCFELGRPVPGLDFYRNELRKVIETAFFAGQETLTLRAPDGRTSTVPVERLREMLERMQPPPQEDR